MSTRASWAANGKAANACLKLLTEAGGLKTSEPSPNNNRGVKSPPLIAVIAVFRFDKLSAFSEEAEEL